MTREKSRTEAVYERLRDDILAGVLTPGDRLRFADLNDRYGASMGVIREALYRLTEQGLVTSETQLGFRVTSLSAHDLLDLTEARCTVEGLALERAIEHGTVEWESALLAAHHALTRTQQTHSTGVGLSSGWSSAHERFHSALIANCPNIRLKSLASTLRASGEVYRHWTVEYDDRDTAGEHQALCEAALARETNRACRLLVEHLIETARLLLRKAPDADPSCATRLQGIRDARADMTTMASRPMVTG